MIGPADRLSRFSRLFQGDQCEFLHEFNLRRMPDCHWLLKFGYCSAGDECLYYHPHTKKRICEDYARGFCYYGACLRSNYVRIRSLTSTLQRIVKVRLALGDTSLRPSARSTPPASAPRARIARRATRSPDLPCPKPIGPPRRRARHPLAPLRPATAAGPSGTQRLSRRALAVVDRAEVAAGWEGREEAGLEDVT